MFHLCRFGNTYIFKYFLMTVLKKAAEKLSNKMGVMMDKWLLSIVGEREFENMKKSPKTCNYEIKAFPKMPNTEYVLFKNNSEIARINFLITIK